MSYYEYTGGWQSRLSSVLWDIIMQLREVSGARVIIIAIYAVENIYTLPHKYNETHGVERTSSYTNQVLQILIHTL